MFLFVHKNSLFLVLLLLPSILSSEGDGSLFYQNCIRSCSKRSCSMDGSYQPKYADSQDTWCWMLLWTCTDDCIYQCMWQTVDDFAERGFKMPKFYGKWPFKRYFGVQEPATAFACLLNLLSHLHMYSEMKKEISISECPMMLLWHAYALVYINGWHWSIVFHIRNTAFTEFMAYACALSMFMSHFIAALLRIFYSMRKSTVLIFMFLVMYFAEHVNYMYSGKIEYDYNMLVNIIFGVLATLLWMCWACHQYLAGRHYAWRLLVFTVLSALALTLELFDFPPRSGWDAHALWHLSTSSLPMLFYRFVIDDVKFLMATHNFANNAFGIT